MVEMKEYIDRVVALREWPRCDEPADAYQYIKNIPAADVRPVKRGHWVKRMEEHTTPKYNSFTPIWSCSECGLDYDPALAPRIHFCYNCGADMRECDHEREA